MKHSRKPKEREEHGVDLKQRALQNLPFKCVCFTDKFPLSGKHHAKLDEALRSYQRSFNILFVILLCVLAYELFCKANLNEAVATS